jgi:hypothetical protein
MHPGVRAGARDFWGRRAIAFEGLRIQTLLSMCGFFGQVQGRFGARKGFLSVDVVVLGHF